MRAVTKALDGKRMKEVKKVFARILIILIGTAVLIGAGIAETPAPKSPTLPFYYITGKVTNPVKLEGRKVILHGTSFAPEKSIAADTDAATGTFKVNLGELYYYHPDTLFNFSAGDFAKSVQNSPLFLSVVKNDANTWGTQDIISIDWGQGYINKNLTLVEGAGPKSGMGQIRGKVSESTASKPLAGAQVSANGTPIAVSGTDGVYASYEVTPGTYKIECAAEGYQTGAKDGVQINTNEATILNIMLDPLPPSILIPGIMPLTIEVVGSDIKVSWEKDAFPKSKLIYVLSGDGTGSFKNEWDQSVWKSANTIPDIFLGPTAGDISYYDAGYFIHKNQVAAGDKEVYYKMVYGEALIDVPKDFPIAFAATPAVGKINYTFEKGNNYFSRPFSGSADINKVFGTSGFVKLSKVLDYQKGSDKFKAATFDTTWKDSYALQPGKGYVFFNYGDPVTATLVGDVNPAPGDFSAKLSIGNNYIGLPYPAKQKLPASFGTNPLKNDGMLIYQHASDKFNKKSCSKDGAFDDATFEINPLTGYVYFRYQGEFLWQPNQ